MSSIITKLFRIFPKATKSFKCFYLGLLLICIPVSYAISQNLVTDSLAITPIQLSEIATVTAEDIMELRDFMENKVQINEVYKLRPEIDSLKINTKKLEELSNQFLQNHITYQYYSSLILRWTRIDNSIVNPTTALKSYSSSLEEILESIDRNRLKWKTTQTIIEEKDLSKDSDQRIFGVLHYMDSIQAIIKDSLATSVDLLNQVTDLSILTTDFIKRLEELQQVQINKFILQKEQAIWKLKSQPDSLYNSDTRVLLVFGIEDSKQFLQREWKILLVLLIVCILIFLLLSWLRKIHVHDDILDDPHASIRKYILSQPFTTAFMLTLMLSLWWLPERPAIFTQLFQTIFIIPFILLYRGLVMKSFRYGIYILALLFLFEISVNFYQLGSITNKLLSIAESLVLGIVFIWFIKNSRKHTSKFSMDIFLTSFFTKAGPIYFLAVSVAFFSAVFGYNNLSRLLNSGALFSLLLGLLFGLAFLCVITLLYFFIQTSYADKSLIIKGKKGNLFNWLRKILRLAAVAFWAYYTLKVFYLWQPVSSVLTEFWQTGYQFGAVNLTIGSIISFALILYLSWLVSYLIRVLLEVEIFGRFNLPRGVPMAVSSLTQYFLIVLGFIIALSRLGFDLKNLSLLAGALGVGIGFGLQNTVNNFISGLILVFERPVTVGDIVSVAGHEGEVQKIGLRASTIRQWDGSEVIVPNADLISQKVVNWTLTKYNRRLILTIHTHLDTDPDLVIKLMTEATTKVSFVLKNPQAKTYFHGVKDKHLEFALFYWISGDLLDCRSMVNLEVQKSLKASGIKFQMPIPLQIDDSKIPDRKN